MNEQVPYEEILRILQEKNYTGEWFFEQWNNNKDNAFKAFY